MARRHTVAAVAFDGLAPFELAVACEVFGIDRSDLGVPWYRFFVCSVEDRPVRTSVGFEIDTPYRLRDLRRADTIVVPARGHGDLEAAPELLDALRAANRRGARIMSVCTGALLLGAAGFLTGQPATTHPNSLRELEPYCGEVRSERVVDAGGVVTAGGVTAAIDLGLHLVRRLAGAEACRRVARQMDYPYLSDHA